MIISPELVIEGTTYEAPEEGVFVVQIMATSAFQPLDPNRDQRFTKLSEAQKCFFNIIDQIRYGVLYLNDHLVDWVFLIQEADDAWILLDCFPNQIQKDI